MITLAVACLSACIGAFVVSLFASKRIKEKDIMLTAACGLLEEAGLSIATEAHPWNKHDEWTANVAKWIKEYERQ